ncbi:hypothetical protein SKAU_G00263100 [Synaphobranchus kaupii]|uniref:Uncharacterized protein n=1 Tax=Synaphobranchus kaupii TaxID=118154 RepID=A0A9Q1EYW5_SYNKA|nr:hypothetical protein SKAU_G00263100 [Synaphobranchus kaupii]
MDTTATPADSEHGPIRHYPTVSRSPSTLTSEPFPGPALHRCPRARVFSPCVSIAGQGTKRPPANCKPCVIRLP